MQRQGATSYFRVLGPLLLLVAALGYVNWRLWGYTPDTSPLLPSVEATARTSPANATLESDLSLPARSAAELPQTTRRPLFFANRRPVAATKQQAAVTPAPSPAAAAQATPPTSLDQFQLVGIMRTGKAKARALIRTAGEPQGTWIAVGDNIRGWQLKEIGDDKAVFEANGQRGLIKLYAAGKAP